MSDPRPWVREHGYPETWHYYPNGHFEVAACGRRPIPGAPLAKETCPVTENVCLVCEQIARVQETTDSA
ncbi:hypothetical protein [Petrachloros mirabilis]